MTRINIGIDPSKLTDQHLLAEHREIKRICDLFNKTSKPFPSNHIPKEFTLGLGHMKFFLDKGDYTFRRYKKLYKECIDRGFQVTDFSDSWQTYWQNPRYCTNYMPKSEDRVLIQNRIIENITKSNQVPRYKGSNVSKEWACKLVKS